MGWEQKGLGEQDLSGGGELSSCLTACQTHTPRIVLLAMLHWAFWKKLTMLAGLSVVKMGLKPGAACDSQILQFIFLFLVQSDRQQYEKLQGIFSLALCW